MKDYKAKETMLVITVGFLVLYMVFHRHWMLVTALVVGITGILSFYLSQKIDWLWNKLALIMGFISNTIILTACFYVIITPIALIRKLLGKKDMLSVDKTSPTNFETTNHTYTKEDFVKLW